MAEPLTTPRAEALLEHAGFLRALARHLLFDEGQAEDVVQDALVVALQRRPRDGVRRRAWLAGVTRNLARKSLRDAARRARRERDAARPEAFAPAADAVARLEVQRRVVEAVQQLDEPYRTVVVLRHFEERKPREIARLLDVPVRTVETRLRRAVLRLRGLLDARHDGDRRAWCLGLAAVVPLSGPATAAAGVTAAAAALGGILVTKTAMIVTTALVAAAFVAGWGLKPGPEGPARAGRDLDPEAAAPLAGEQLADLRRQLESERGQRKRLEAELEEARRAAEKAAAAADADAAPADAGNAGRLEGPAFAYAEHAEALRGIDWDEVGESMHALPPLLAELVRALQETGELPESAGEIQRWNGPLVKAAMKLMSAGVPGTGVNGSFTHPAVAANLVHAALAKSDSPLSERQQEVVRELGRRYAEEEARRLAAYPDGVSALRKLADEAALKDRFFAEVDGVLSAQQRDLLSPESVRGLSQVDLMSSGVALFMHTRPVPYQDRETLVKTVTDRHLLEFDLDASARPVVEGLVRQWAQRAEEAGIAGPRDVDLPNLPLAMRNERVRKAAQLQADLRDEMAAQLSLTEAQRKKLLEDLAFVVPYRPEQ